MKFGFNSKVQVGRDVYDVQTEERGISHPFIDTLVLNRGRVVYRHSTSYEDLAASGALDQAILRARVEKQHREILDALRAGALSLEKAASAKQEGIAVKLLNAGSWLESGHVSLDIEVSSKRGGQPVTGAQVEAFIEGGAGSPESYFGRTDAAGRTSLQFPFPLLTETMTIQVNGERREVPKGLNVTQLVAHLGLTANRLAIERNLEIVPRGQWGATAVSGGDRFEIVHLVGGG